MEKENWFDRVEKEHQKSLGIIKEKCGSLILTIEQMEEQGCIGWNFNLNYQGKDVFHDDNHYDQYSSAANTNILNYANGKFACYGDDSKLRCRLY